MEDSFPKIIFEVAYVISQLEMMATLFRGELTSDKQTQRELGSVEVGEDKFPRIILEVAQHPQQKTHVGDYWPIEQKHR